MVYTSPITLSMYSHPVSVKALSSVVSITVLEVRVPSCPMFLAIIKQLTVVGEPSITSMEMSLSFVNPKAIAIGRNKE